MNFRIIFFLLGVNLLICCEGYCLFRDDIGTQQVQSAIRIQRAKDEQRKTQTDQGKKQESISTQAESADNTYSSQNPALIPARNDRPALLDNQTEKPLVQFKRYTPQGMIVDTMSPAVTPVNTNVSKEEKKPALNGLIFLLLVLGLAGFAAYKKQRDK